MSAMRCRTCTNEAAVGIRSGLETHPTCSDCAEWWSLDRAQPLEAVDPKYEYIEDGDEDAAAAAYREIEDGAAG